jgi:hypothetical protein
MAVIAAAIVVRRNVHHWRMFRRFTVWRLFVGRLRIFIVRVAVAIAIIGVAGFVLPLALYRVDAAEWSSAAVQLVLTLVAHLLQFELLLCFQVAAEISVSAIALAALLQFSVLALVQRVYLVIEVFFQIPARIGSFRLACVQC